MTVEVFSNDAILLDFHQFALSQTESARNTRLEALAKDQKTDLAAFWTREGVGAVLRVVGSLAWVGGSGPPAGEAGGGFAVTRGGSCRDSESTR